ncbi:amino acid ABC transporter substrate-binding protein (PAAT family) [Halopolyspora algeriensis]|uniref:Amino acid ABC transporter substrate-binding protein (PAAT family) n=1 Tax=Halopolyspora algeriensis TaxID=1500506 RepID=A0A368VSR2_9ACTN|nr:glutamate ABC transporter substrate-binding protein [Halopolyspora algeriensis]RCW44022.1 amino acid ABC transporter substrate-binding protein (PAAT family) [Halopolyspora algeriensis]TQM53475.1 amino acid ABC transporter substrate-binding protein (PAAT family) [Halopolyspora algeriensis]
MRSRKPRAVAAALAATLGLVLTACGSGSTNQLGSGGQDSFQAPVAENPSFEPGTTMAKLSKQGSITVGTKFDQPLFGLKGLDGTMQGFDIEIARIIAGQLGIPADKINWVKTPSKSREAYIEQDRVDMVVATYTINDKRAQRVSFAGPYYNAGQDLMVKKDNTEITGPESLRKTGAKVCSARGSTPSEEIKKYIDPANLVLFDVYSKCADALRTGQVDAVTTDNVILLGLVNESGGKFKLVGKPFTEEPYGVGITKGDTEFCQFIHQSLTKAAQNGTYQKAWEATAGKVSEENPKLPELNTCS